jgi:hypothetical protein
MFTMLVMLVCFTIHAFGVRRRKKVVILLDIGFAPGIVGIAGPTT